MCQTLTHISCLLLAGTGGNDDNQDENVDKDESTQKGVCYATYHLFHLPQKSVLGKISHLNIFFKDAIGKLAFGS